MLILTLVSAFRLASLKLHSKGLLMGKTLDAGDELFLLCYQTETRVLRVP